MVGLGKANLNLQLMVGPCRENFLFSLYDNEKRKQKSWEWRKVKRDEF